MTKHDDFEKWYINEYQLDPVDIAELPLIRTDDGYIDGAPVRLRTSWRAYQGTTSIDQAWTIISRCSPEVLSRKGHFVSGGETFQERVAPWMGACFTSEIAADTVERNDRFIEEALELIQACGSSRDRAHALVDYVFDRPVGEKAQEVGGVMVTLAALCLAQGIDMHEAGDVELARVWTKIEQIRTKQAAKPKGSALPEWKPTHRHYKGGLYRVLHEATHSETELAMTVYEGQDGRRWARPSEMFNEDLPDGRRRFQPIGA